MRLLKRSKKPKTLRSVLVRAIVLPVFIVAELACGYLVGAKVSGHDGVMQFEQSPPAEARELSPAEKVAQDAAVKAVSMSKAHGCWNGPAPADMEGKMPGHTIVTLPGDKEPTYGDSKDVHVALEHVFGKKTPGMTVHAFCR